MLLAHGTSIFVSTPFTPPDTFIWVLPLSLILIAAGQTWYIRQEISSGGWTLFPVSICVHGLCLFVLLAAGTVVYMLTTAPLPSLAIGFQPLYGLDWKLAGFLFLFGNGLVIYALLWSTSFLCKIYDVKTEQIKTRTRNMTLGIYGLCLIPMIVTGALTHGFPGFYTDMHCRTNLRELGRAINTYANENEGRTPEVKNIHELYTELRPHLDQLDGKDVLYCRVEDVLFRNPEPYKWNVDASGVSLEEVKDQDPPLLLLACPYHSRKNRETEYHALYASDFKKHEQTLHLDLMLKTADRIERTD